jgi:hypothetical protein
MSRLGRASIFFNKTGGRRFGASRQRFSAFPRRD